MCGVANCGAHLGDYWGYVVPRMVFEPIAGMVFKDAAWRLSRYAVKRLRRGQKPKYTHGVDGMAQHRFRVAEFPILVTCPTCQVVNTVREHVDSQCALCEYERKHKQLSG
jgi:hypothetical protein